MRFFKRREPKPQVGTHAHQMALYMHDLGGQVEPDKAVYPTVNPARAVMGIDDSIPSEGVRYGGADTIHNTGDINIVMEDGVVNEVWFRCQPLSFTVSNESGFDVYGGRGAKLVAVEVVR